MKNYKNKGMGIVYGLLIILFHAVGHWLTVQYNCDKGFHQFVIIFKDMVFSYFNSNIPLDITIGISAIMIIMSIISGIWKYND